MLKDFKKIIVLGVLLTSGLILMLVFSALNKTVPIEEVVDVEEPVLEEEMLGGSLPGSEWVIVDRFDGFQTKKDASKISNGGNPNGQNTIINDGDRISIRDIGYEHFSTSTASTTAQAINSLHTFSKRDGENIMMRTRGNLVEYYESGNTTWTSVSTTYSNAKDFGFADFTSNSDIFSYVYFGNAVESGARWTGNHTMTNGAYVGGAGSVIVDSTTGFPATGNIILCDTPVAYTSKTATTFVVVASAPACNDNFGVAESLETQSTSPLGNIYIAKDNRLFISGVVSSTQIVLFSTYGDATTWAEDIVADGTDSSPGFFDLQEGGGKVTGMAADENSIYFFKKSIIYKATLTDTTYSVTPLKSFDGGKSKNAGALSSRSVFSGGNGLIFVTADKQVMSLERVSQIDVPQLTPISDVIEPTISNSVFTSSAGITFRDRSYIAAKTDSNSANNDVVYIWNNSLNAWESPLVGWNVSNFTIYNDELFWSDAITPNVRKVTSIPLDGEFGVTANYRTKQFTFGVPWGQKEMDSVFIEGYISDNSTLAISLLLDETGYTQTFTTNFVGTETDFLFQETNFNVFGFNAFGTERFGSSEDFSGKKKFRVYLNKSFRRTPFFVAQLEFASDGENEAWEITRYGMKVRVLAQPEDRSLYRVFQ